MKNKVVAQPRRFHEEIVHRTKTEAQNRLMEAVPAAVGGAMGAAATGVGQAVVPILKRQLTDAYAVHATRGLPGPVRTALHPRNRLKLALTTLTGSAALAAGSLAGLARNKSVRDAAVMASKLASVEKEAMLGPLIKPIVGFGIKHFAGPIMAAAGKQMIKSTGKFVAKHPIATAATVGGGGFVVGKNVFGD